MGSGCSVRDPGLRREGGTGGVVCPSGLPRWAHCITLYITGPSGAAPPHLPGPGPPGSPRAPEGAGAQEPAQPPEPGAGAGAEEPPRAPSGVCGPPLPGGTPGMASGKAAGERRWELVRW